MRSIDRSIVDQPEVTPRSLGRRQSVPVNGASALDGVLLGFLSLMVGRFTAGPAAMHDLMVAGSGAALLIYGRGRGRWEYAAPFLRSPAVQCRTVAIAMLIGAAAMTAALMLMSWPVARALPYSAVWLAGGTVLLGLARLAIFMPRASRTTGERRSAS